MQPMTLVAPKPSLARRVLVTFAALSLVLTGWVSVAPQAQAVPSLSSGWTQPLDTMSGLSAGFLANDCGHAGYGSYIPGKYHIANDYGRSAGTAVYSIGAGTVVAKQSNWPGSAIFVRHMAPDGTQFLAVYGHVNSGLVVNNTVVAGQQIGTVYDDHLHFGIREATVPATSNNGSMSCSSWPNTNGYRDPLPFLAAHPVGGSQAEEATVFQSSNEKLVKSSTTDGFHHIFSVAADGVHETYWKPGAVTPATGLVHARSGVESIAVSYQSNGTTQLYTATSNTVYETYWAPGTPLTTWTVTTTPDPIVSIAKAITSDGYHHVFTATTNAVYETYWKPGVAAPATGQIIARSGIVDISVSYQSNGTAQLYTATANTVYETYWQPGVPLTTWTVTTTPHPIVSIVKKTTSDGFHHVFTATTTGVYETYWKPGVAAPATGQVATRTDMTDIAVSYQSNGTTQLYTATSNTVYETYWAPGNPLVTGGLVSVPNIIGMTKTITSDGYHHIFMATPTGVHETYWKPGVTAPATGQLGSY